jgi:hypothetical protein
MRETVVRSKFPAICDSFLNWRSAADIAGSAESCFQAAMQHFGSELKIKAICTVAATVTQKGFDRIIDEVHADPLAALQQFPFIGPITCFHLAKNLGAPLQSQTDIYRGSLSAADIATTKRSAAPSHSLLVTRLMSLILCCGASPP